MSFFKNIFNRRSNAISVSGLPAETTNAYNKTRQVRDKTLLCHAPFSNLYFNSEGHVALCWKTFHKHETYSEEKSIMDIWKGENFEKIRAGIRSCNLDFGCQECKKHLLEGNYVNVLSKAYDNDHLHPVYPTIMEFELSNRCNLGCTMCNGNLSSTIRKDREKLPPLPSPYGQKFVEELNEFIPYLKEARFNGGEPFLIKQYYDIWDNISELNPKLKMVIATNGTVLTSKVKEYMEKSNFHFNISIDGFSPETYESIRINGNFERLMENLDYFISYCRKNKRTLCIMINPLRQNWWEMPEFVNWCNQKDIHLWFNSIIKPADQALWSLPSSELEKILSQLSSAKLEMPNSGNSAIHKYNIDTYNNLVNQQIKTWHSEAVEREATSKPPSEPSSPKLNSDVGEGNSNIDTAQKKIIAHFGSTRKTDGQFLLERLSSLESTINTELLVDQLYGLVLTSDLEVLFGMAKDLSVEELKEMFDAEITKSQ